MADQQSTFIRDLAAATAGDRAAAERNAAWRAGAEHVAAEINKLLTNAAEFGDEVDAEDLSNTIKPFADGHPEDIFGDGYRRGVKEACKEFMQQYNARGHRYDAAGRAFREFCDVVLTEED